MSIQDTFRGLWLGGYYTGDPLDPMGETAYLDVGYVTGLYLTYRVCIQPLVGPNTTVLEISPGRGAWTRCFTHCAAKEIWALDALSAEENGFWEYVGESPNIKYFQVRDEQCSMVHDDSIDYFFSFGTFCHFPPTQTQRYMNSVFRKMRSGARGFLMFADYDKYNSMIDRRASLSVPISPGTGKHSPMAKLVKLMVGRTFKKQDKNENLEPRPGRFYHLGTADAVRMFEAIGFRVVERDVEVNHRDPVIHFMKR